MKILRKLAAAYEAKIATGLSWRDILGVLWWDWRERRKR